MNIFKILLCLTTIPFGTFVYSQQPSKVIFGKVLSQNNKLPIHDATITAKNSAQATVTNEKGEFSIAIDLFSDTLIISHVGYNQLKLLVTDKEKAVTIYLIGSFQELDEVIVNTGLQKLPKERLTGSFTVIDNKLLNEQVGTNFIERLKYISNGVTYFPSGLQSHSEDQLIIRGISSLTTSIQKPLIIVDNFEYQGDLKNINPNDIETITFLKDAAAGSIWGAKAANGVLVITTKKSRYAQRSKIDLTTNLTIIDKPNLFNYRNIAPSDLVDLEKFLFNQGYNLDDTLSPVHPPFSPVYEILMKQQNGQLSNSEANALIESLKSHDVRNDYLNFFYRKAINQQYALNFRGGSNNISWILSAGFDKNVNNLNSLYNRANFRFENSYKVSNALEVSTSVYYTESRSVSGNPDYGSIQMATGGLPVYTRFADGNGNALPLYTRYRQGYIDTLGGGNLLDWKYYPLEDYKHSRSRSQLRDINAFVGMSYQLFSWLNLNVKYRYEKQQIENRTLYNEESYLTRDLINSFTQINPLTGQLKYIVPRGGILDQGYGNITAQNIRGQLNINKDWGSHKIMAIAGAESSETITQNNAYRTYGYYPDILSFANVDYTTEHPHFINGSSWIPNSLNFERTNTRFVSFYGNASYSLKNKYILTGSIRRDASNLFGADIKDKWKPLWSAGIGWNISSEPFYHLEQIPTLKLRMTYGYQGNVDPSKVSVATFHYSSASPYTSTPTAVIQNFINPDLRWEQTGMFNIALDFGIKNNRLSGSIEFYHKNITDLYGPAAIDPTTGLGTSTVIKNVGNMKGNGVDLNIRSLNINQEFKWVTDFILNTYHSKIKKYYYNETTLKASQLVGFGGGLEGHPPYSLFVYRWAGLDPLTGDPQGYLDGQVSKDWLSITGNASTMEDIKYIGSRLPTMFGSLGNTFTWKGFSLSARIGYRFGYYFLRESVNYNSLIRKLIGHADYSLRWQQSGDENKTSVPSFIYSTSPARDAFYNNSEILVEKGDHIRFQYLNIGYEIEKDKVRKLPVERISFYVVVSNLGIIWRANKAGIDPDNSNGIPPAKNYSLGVKISF